MNRYRNAYDRLNSQLNVVSQNENRSKIGLYINALWYFIRYGITPNEYLGWNCWRYSKSVIKSFYTARDSARYEKHFNNPASSHLFNNKVDFNTTFSEFVKREWIFTSNSSKMQIAEFIANHKKMVVKPIGLSSGKGIYTIESTSQWKGDDGFLIEDYIQQHPALSKLNPSSVNSVRVYTLRRKNGTPSILSASIRVGGEGADVDNYHAGGCGYPIDIETGVIYLPGTDIKGNSYLYHPTTGEKMIGFEIPNWKDLIEFVFKAMEVVPQARLLAWDVAVLQDGFEMIEGNYNGDPGFLQAPSKQGKKLDIIKEL